MSDNFNPYHKWLGSRAATSRSNYYRLLGLELGECDPDVIAHAAEQRMMLLRTLPDSARTFLNSSSMKFLEARGCLLDSEKKASLR